MVIAIIPARSGSKGLPGKNVALIGENTLLELAVRQGLQSSKIDKVYISTDDPDYEKIGIDAGALSLGLRPVELSADDSKTIDVLKHMLEHEDLQTVEYVVLLQVTSPIRSVTEIDHAIELARESGNSVVSVSVVDEPHPFKMKTLEKGAVVRPFVTGASSEVNRQTLAEVYQLTGAIYVSSYKNILENQSLFSENTQALIQESFVNIDSEKDLIWLKHLYATGRFEFNEKS